MTAAHYKGGHHPGNDLGLHYTALPPIVASCPYSDQLLVTRKFWSPGANRPSQASRGTQWLTCATRQGGSRPHREGCRRAADGHDQDPAQLTIGRGSRATRIGEPE